MTGRKSESERGGGELSLSWLLVVFLSMNQSPVVSVVWTNNIPSDLTSKTALKTGLEMISEWRTLEKSEHAAQK